MIKYEEILRRHYPELRFIIENDVYEGLEILSDHSKPSKKELDELWSNVLQELENEKEEELEKRTAAEAKLAALGLTADDLKALGL